MNAVIRRRGLLCLLSALAAPAAFADDSLVSLYEAAKTEQPLIWYVSFYGDDVAEITARAFEKKYPGLRVVPVRRTTGSTFQRINQDLKVNTPTAGVLSMTGIGDFYSDLKTDGHLMHYVPQNAAVITKAFQEDIDPGNVYPFGGGLMALAYSTKTVAPADVPKSWDDLLDPKWAGRLALGHPAFSGFDAALDVALTRKKGWGYFRKIAANDPLIQRSTFDTLTALNSGERSVAPMPDTLTLDGAAKGNPIDVIYPTDGSALLLALTAILRNAPAPNAAKLFTEFLLGPEHAQIMVAANYVSVRPEVRMVMSGGHTLDQIELIPLKPSAVFGKELADVVENWRDLFGG